MGVLLDMYGNPVTVTNTPQTYDRQEVEGDNSNSAEIVDVPQPAVEQPDMMIFWRR